MYQLVKEVALKTGERVELGVVMGPDLVWGPKLEHLLGHKGEPWNWQIRQCLSRGDLGLETRCYLLSKAGRPIANICTFESGGMEGMGGVGIFGHVYTVPEERKKGAADILNKEVMRDFKARGGEALYLGTIYDTPAYHLYRQYGFESVEPGSGYMGYTREGKAGFEKRYFSPGEGGGGTVRIETLAFKHWPVLPALSMMNHPARIRVLGMGVIGATSTEEGSLGLLKAAADSQLPVTGKVAVNQVTGAPVVLACCKPEAYFGAQVMLLDVFFAPGFAAEAIKTVEALELPAGRKVVCYSDGLWPEKEGVLEAAGFKQEAVLRKHLKCGEAVLDVTLWAKNT